MKLIERYIAKTVLAAIGLVTLMLAGLQLFILFVNQLGDLGKGDYGIVDAMFYVLFDMPYEVYLFFPMASLLGCLIGLGMLANHRELIVIRASGMSIWQITLAVLKVALLVVTVVTAVSELFIPSLVRYANDQKLQAMSGGQTLRTAKGIWIRNQNDFISIATILSNNQLLHVNQFHFDATHHLRYARSIEKIEHVNGIWHAYGVAETNIQDTEVKATYKPSLIWEVQLKPSILSVSSSEPDEMTLLQIHQFLKAQKQSKQVVSNYQLVYWQRVIQPLTTAVMMMLAIPFIFGPLRSSTMGSKLLVGATMGFGFHILNRFLGSVSQVYQLPPFIAAIGPTLLFAALGVYLMRRVR